MTLIYFLAGCVFYQLVAPVVDAISQYILTIFEYQKTKIGVKMQTMVDEYEAAEVPAKKHPCGFCEPAIGFEVEPEEEVIEEDED